jgi:toxin ParE1/3/4
VGRPSTTGRISFTPEAERQLNEIDDWIATAANAVIARHFASTILEHIDGIVTFPLAGRARDDVRPGMRTTTFKKRTVVAYLIDETLAETVITVLGVFHGGQHGERVLSQEQGDADAAL